MGVNPVRNKRSINKIRKTTIQDRPGNIGH
jgi:hypothetical protein